MMQLRSRRSPHVIIQAVRSRTNGCDRLTCVGPGSRRCRLPLTRHPPSSPRRRLPPHLASYFLRSSGRRRVTFQPQGPAPRRSVVAGSGGGERWSRSSSCCRSAATTSSSATVRSGSRRVPARSGRQNFAYSLWSGADSIGNFVREGADRGEVPKGSAEIFFRKVKFWNDDEAEEAPPVFVRIYSLLLRSYSDCKFFRNW